MKILQYILFTSLTITAITASANDVDEFYDLFPTEHKEYAKQLGEKIFSIEARAVINETEESAANYQHRGFRFPVNLEDAKRLVQEVQAKKARNQSVSVLEIGCASGELGILLGLAGADQVVLNDISSGELEAATRNIETVQHISSTKYRTSLMDITDFLDEPQRSDEGEKFDIVVCCNVIHFMNSLKSAQFMTSLGEQINDDGLVHMISDSTLEHEEDFAGHQYCDQINLGFNVQYLDESGDILSEFHRPYSFFTGKKPMEKKSFKCAAVASLGDTVTLDTINIDASIEYITSYALSSREEIEDSINSLVDQAKMRLPTWLEENIKYPGASSPPTSLTCSIFVEPHGSYSTTAIHTMLGENDFSIVRSGYMSRFSSIKSDQRSDEFETPYAFFRKSGKS